MLDKKNVQKRIFSNQITKERLLSSIDEKNRWREKRIEEYIQLNIKPQKELDDYQDFNQKTQNIDQVIRSPLSFREKNIKGLCPGNSKNDGDNNNYDSETLDMENSKGLFDKTPRDLVIIKHQSSLNNLFLQCQQKKKKKKNTFNYSQTQRENGEKHSAFNSPIQSFWEYNNKSGTKSSPIKKEASCEKLTLIIESHSKISDFNKDRTNTVKTLNFSKEKRKLYVGNRINQLQNTNNKLHDFFQKKEFDKKDPLKEKELLVDSKTDRSSEFNTIFKRKSKSYGNIFKTERKLPLKYFSDEIKSKKLIKKKNI